MTALVQLDEYRHAVLALEMTLEQLERVDEDPRRWAWALISLHNALQGCMVLALEGSGAATLTSRRRPMNGPGARAPGGSLPEIPTRPDGDAPEAPGRYLDRFLDLWEKVKDSDPMLRSPHSRVLQPTEDQESSVRWLNAWRDRFVHYRPGATTLDTVNPPWRVVEVVRVIEWLLEESGNVRFPDPELETRAEQLVQAIHWEAEGMMQ